MSFFDLTRLFDERPEPPLRPVPGEPSRGPPTDDTFISSLDPVQGVDIEGVTFGILYCDSTGAESRRTIRCSRAARGKGGVYLIAWCVLRSEWRTFRVDRIEEVFDYRTGELLGNARDYLNSLVGEPTEPREALAYWSGYDRCREAVRTLLFLAMADGELHDAELNVILSYAVGRVAREAPDARVSHEAASLWISNQVPNRKQALAGVRHAYDDVEEGALLADAIFDTMLADGEATDEELKLVKAFVGSMERRERKNAPR